MSHPGHGPRVAVVGGGILGVSTAAHLAQRGASVTLLTENVLASGASGRSLSWLNSYGPRTPEYHQLRLAGLDRYRRLAAQTDASAWLRFDGGLTWPAAGEVDGHRAAFEHMRQIGYDAEWLTAAQVAERTPGVDVTAIPDEGAIFNPGEGWVELPRLVEHLAGQIVRAGGEIRTDAGRAEIVVADGRVTGVQTADGDLLGVDAAVLATGPAVPGTVADLGVKIPDATPISLLVRTPPVHLPLRAVLNTPRAAVRPTPNGCLYIDSGWSEEEVVVREDGSYEVRDSTVQGLLREASAVLAGSPVLTAESYGVGPKPIPGDGEPVLGRLPEIAGYHIAFTHSGATLGLIAGELLADEIVRGEPSPLLETFRPGRFDQYHPGRPA
jgi:glycine/D-amino acid oxidase-like deaminating enzyme